MVAHVKTVLNPLKTVSMLALKQNEKQAIMMMVRLLKKKYPVEKIILFGSKARGDGDDGSDVDIMLLTSRPINWKERERLIGEIFDIELECDVVISILDTTTQEWETGMFSYFPIRKNIYQDGIIA